jgi:putative oxidoreductase
MKKILSTGYSAGAFNLAMLLLRLTVGVLMMHHGYGKLTSFGQMKDHFPNFLGLGSSITLALDVFAEFFCALFLILGLFTRLASLPLIVSMFYAVIKVHNMNLFMEMTDKSSQWNGEPATLYLVAFIVLLLVGPGRVSVDSMIGK